MKKALTIAFFSVLCGMPLLGYAIPVEIDLTTFTGSPTAYVVVDDQYSATLYESPDPVRYTYLENDFVPVPSNATTVEFAYEVYLDDPPIPILDVAHLMLYDPVAHSAYPGYEVVIFGWDPPAGTIVWDITGQPFVGGTVGIRFALDDVEWTLPEGTDSYLKISTGPAPVPEANTLMLFGSGLSGLLFYARRRRLMRF